MPLHPLVLLIMGLSISILPASSVAQSGQNMAEVDLRELNYAGVAGPRGKRARLTGANSALQAGAAWHPVKQQVAAGFETEFRYVISGTRHNHGDGFAFVVQNYRAVTLGQDSFALGYGRIPNSLAIEFDTIFQDYMEDPGEEHIAMHSLGRKANSSHSESLIAAVMPPFKIASSSPRRVRIRYEPGWLEVYVGRRKQPVLATAVDLEELLQLDRGRAWVGFTASTEPYFYDNHDIVAWTIGPLIQ